MAQECILSIDQGTSGSRVYLLNKKGKVLANEYEEFPQYFPQAAWVEHDPEEIWLSVQRLIQKVLKKSGLPSKYIHGIGITNQRETAVIWDRKTGKPIYRAIVWQCRRTAEHCVKLIEGGYTDTIHEKTGLLIDAYFSGTKFAWILDHVDGAHERAKRGELAAGTIDSWLLFKLTAEHSTDYTNASRTLIYNISKKDWDDELLEIFDIPRAILATAQSSRSHFGQVINVSGLEGVPVLAMMGDQQSALFGQLCHKAGEAKNTYGTGAFLLFHTGNQFVLSKSGILTTLACNENGQVAYALEGAIFIAGAVMQWLRDSLHFFKQASESEKLIGGLREESDGVVFVPAFAGLAAPHWDMQARGALFGLSRDTSIQHIVRAALKSIALQSYDLVDAMEKATNKELTTLKVDGGATANSFLMQYQADILNKRLCRTANLDATALGSAYLAGIHAGIWTLEDLHAFQGKATFFEPKMEQSVRKKELAYWRQGVERTKAWSAPEASEPKGKEAQAKQDSSAGESPAPEAHKKAAK